MSSEAAYYHPIVRLFNAERLYYILVQSLEPMPEDRNALSTWLREAQLMSKTNNAATMDVIFGEADLLIRVWADAEKLDAFLGRLNDQGKHRFRIKSLILVNSMDVCYQRQMENPSLPTMPPWDWTALTDWLDELRRAGRKSECMPQNPCLWFPSSHRKARSSKHLVRFWIFCENPSSNYWPFFEQLRRYVLDGEFPTLYGVEDPGAPDPNDRSEQGRRQIREVSFCAYEEVQGNPKQNGIPFAREAALVPTDQGMLLTRGVIIKGEFEMETGTGGTGSHGAYQSLMENLSFFVHEIRNRFSVRTVTYLCARHLFSESGFRPSSFTEINERRREILYSLLKTPVSTKIDPSDIPRAAEGRSEALRARNERIDAFVTDMVQKCFGLIRVYHSTWWQTLAEVRDVFAWVANGNNDALMGVMARDYPVMEKALRDLMDELGANHRWLRQQEEDLERALAPLQSKLPAELQAQKALVRKVRKVFPAEKHITYRGIEEILRYLVSEHAKSTFLSKTQVFGLSELAQAISECRVDRNLLLHGEIESVLGAPIDGEDTPRPLWHQFVINFLWLKLALPIGMQALRAIITMKDREESA